MADTLRIGLIGDFDPHIKAHQAIPTAIRLAAADLPRSVEAHWLATPSPERETERILASYDAFWCVPGSPYASLDGALRAIRYARERGVPFLGTCGGFQHTLLEYARDVLGLSEADHAESNPSAALPLIAPLSCSLVGQRGTIHLIAGSRIAAIYSREEIVEEYHCNFGLSPQYHSLFEQGAMRVTGIDAQGECRVIELTGHPFFIGTLFQPERSAFAETPHPLIRAFIGAAL